MSVNPSPSATVVVGCDNSWASQNAVSAAASQAALRGATLVLLAVVERRPLWPDDLSWVARVEAESVQDAQAAIDLAMAKVVATGASVAVQTVIVNALESAELADVAGRAGLLFLGRRGDGGQVAFSLGSTSWELARRFRCPIQVVHDRLGLSERQHVGPDRAVIAGVEALRAAAVLRVAANEAVIRDLPLVVVHALTHTKGVDRAIINKEWLTCREALAEAHIPAVAPLRVVIAEGDPARALLDRAGPKDLIVVGTRGQERLAGLVAGSVSRQILDQMECDVMVVLPDLGPPATSELIDLAVRS